MDDPQCLSLLGLLREYVREYGAQAQTIPELADDLAMSLDETPNWADEARVEIEQAYGA